MKKIIVGLCLIAAVVLATGLIIGLGVSPLTAQENVEIPYLDEWAGSGHADASAEAFVHWDEDDPPGVPARCANCHTTAGYQDHIGLDGEAGMADPDALFEIGSTVECIACHNEVTAVMDSVTMPSGIEITDLGSEARCMQCHQGRESMVSVNAAIEDAGVGDDEIHEDLGFKNIHYFAAAATKYGTLAKGGYEYEGKAYDGNFAHVDGFESCVQCHDTHTLEVKVDQCVACHEDVTDVEDLKDVRMAGSLVDYDGDGNMVEGVYYELEGLRELLYEAIQAYGDEVTEVPIVYNAESYPYFFNDAEEGYNAWTPRLLKAAYNYQVSLKDPGAFAHGGKYIMQLMYDSIEDLNTVIDDPIDLTDLNRIDHGHFAGSEEAFRHWDEDGEVSASCSKCHSADGLPVFLKDNANVSQPLANGFKCSTCHASLEEVDGIEAPRYEVTEVKFPSGLVIDAESASANTLLCMNCHQGRESTTSVNQAITDSGAGNDEISDALGFKNVHYFPAGVTLYGTEAKGAYEYDGQSYNGFFAHVEETPLGCTDCHDAHTQQVELDTCQECHDGISDMEDLHTIRTSTVDYDGDGDTTEGIDAEIATIQEELYAAIQAYASNTVGTGIEYDSHSYPYFFDDAGERYGSWTPTLLKAAYNYQYSVKDPGKFAHNPEYVIQVLYDSIDDLGGDVSGMTRPTAQ
jgi:hypothetical protein